MTHCVPPCPVHMCSEWSKIGMCGFSKCKHPITRAVTTEVRGVWKCLDCGTILDDRLGPQVSGDR